MGQPYLKYHSDDSMGTVEKVKLKMDVDKTVTTGVYSRVDWVEELFNDYDMHPSGFLGRILFNRGGTYVCGLNINWGNNTVGYRECTIKINGVNTLARDKRTALSAGKDYQQVITIFEFDAEDYVEAYVYHTRGSNLVVKKDDETSFWAFRLN